MERKSLHERLKELLPQLGAKKLLKTPSGSPSRLCQYINGSYGSDIKSEHLERIASSLGDTFPIVCYREDGTLEDLDLDNFKNGKYIENYIGQVIEKHIDIIGLNERELADKVRISKRIKDNEHKNKMPHFIRL